MIPLFIAVLFQIVDAISRILHRLPRKHLSSLQAPVLPVKKTPRRVALYLRYSNNTTRKRSLYRQDIFNHYLSVALPSSGKTLRSPLLSFRPDSAENVWSEPTRAMSWHRQLARKAAPYRAIDKLPRFVRPVGFKQVPSYLEHALGHDLRCHALNSRWSHQLLDRIFELYAMGFTPEEITFVLNRQRPRQQKHV